MSLASLTLQVRSTVALGHGGFGGYSGGACGGGCMGLGFDLWRSTTTLGLGFEEDKVVVWFGF